MADQAEAQRANMLYETDFFAWTQEQARLLRERRFDDLDLENLTDEVASVGRGDKAQIQNRLEVLLSHLLKWKFQPGARSTGWTGIIFEQRRRIAGLVEGSPSLRSYPAQVLDDAYPAAHIQAATETGIDYTLFPKTCPFTIEPVLDPAFFPKEPDLLDQS